MEPKYSEDSLFDGRLICRQHRRGYRFSIDAVLLAHFVNLSSDARVLELGGGCGIISLLLAYRFQHIRIAVLELQNGLADLIRENITKNEAQGKRYRERIEVINGDLRLIDRFVRAGSFDWVVCNPPYRKSGSGRINPANELAVARHELQADLKAVVAACSFAVRTRGRVAVVYPSSRGVSLLHEMRGHGLEPKRLQVIYSYPGSEAKLVLVEAVKGGGEGLIIASPFYVYQEKDGSYSPEMEAYYAP
jgi:tRNA1Val (adenine37-N6)-methyltransferase